MRSSQSRLRRRAQRARVRRRSARNLEGPPRNRRLLLENLEPRIVLSHTMFDPQYWHPDGPSHGIDPEFGVGSNSEYNDLRWTKTATQGDNLKLGDPTVITWSVVPNGTPIPGFNGEAAAASNLRTRLQEIYGGSATDPVKDQPWFSLFVSMFDSWSDETGLTYVHEEADDGATFSGSGANNGVVGTRGDVRIGGHRIDGNSGILAYNFFPNTGDMVIDTDDNFYDNKADNSIRFRNVLADRKSVV